MKTLIALIITSSLIAQNQVINPYAQALGVVPSQPLIIAPQANNQALSDTYVESLIIQQNAQAQINQAMANQALKQANPNYIPRDYIKEQQIIDMLLNEK